MRSSNPVFAPGAGTVDGGEVREEERESVSERERGAFRQKKRAPLRTARSPVAGCVKIIKWGERQRRPLFFLRGERKKRQVGSARRWNKKDDGAITTATKHLETGSRLTRPAHLPSVPVSSSAADGSSLSWWRQSALLAARGSQ